MMQEIAAGLWVFRYPLRMLGTQIGRTVTVMRLKSSDLIIHSTAPFTVEDVAAIRKIGRPRWILDATLFHDTYSREGAAAFAEARYLAPEGFRFKESAPLIPSPAEWAGEVDLLPLEGMPTVREHVFFHRSTRTLIVADLVFNFGPGDSGWTRWFFRNAGGIRQFPGISRLFKASIKDRTAFQQSTQAVLTWGFDRLIVGHGGIIESGGKEKLRGALQRF
jgi:hypothetical protein